MQVKKIEMNFEINYKTTIRMHFEKSHKDI